MSRRTLLELGMVQRLLIALGVSAAIWLCILWVVE